MDNKRFTVLSKSFKLIDMMNQYAYEKLNQTRKIFSLHVAGRSDTRLGILVCIALLSGSKEYGGELKGIVMNSPNALPWVLVFILNWVPPELSCL
jgi:hypothetical protein